MIKFQFSILAVSAVLFAGCPSRPPAASAPASSSGTVEIENTEAFFSSIDGDPQLIIWKGFRVSDAVEFSGGGMSETIKLKGNRSMSWEQLQDTGQVKINDQNYSFDDGRLFLLSFEGNKAKVEQLDHDVSSLGATPQELKESLTKLSQDNSTVKAFLDAAGSN